jgi:hypothetical protein
MENTILPILGSAVTTGGVCYLIFKLWLENEFAKRLSKFEDNLKRDTDTMIARANFRFTHIFAGSTEALVNTYQKLLSIHIALNNFTEFRIEINESERERRKEVLNSCLAEFNNYYPPKRIFIPRATNDRIMIFVGKLMYIILRFEAFKNHEKLEHQDKLRSLELRNEETEIEGLKAEAVGLINSLEHDFQNYLSVPTFER